MNDLLNAHHTPDDEGKYHPHYQIIDHKGKTIVFIRSLERFNFPITLYPEIAINPRGNFTPVKRLMLIGYKVKGV